MVPVPAEIHIRDAGGNQNVVVTSMRDQAPGEIVLR